MSTKNLDKLDSETRDVINYLKNRHEITDLRIEEFSGATSSQINEWEAKNFCNLPHDLKTFYSNQNGMSVEWKFKIDNSHMIPLGRMQINSLKDLTKVGSVLNKDFREPSLFDLEDLQDFPEALLASSNSVSSFSSTSVLSFSTNMSNNSSKTKIKDTNENQSDEIAESAKSDGSSDENELNYENDENESTLKMSSENMLVPHFDETSCNFELDNCNGFGKVCLVYRNTKPGSTSSEQTAEIWFLDRSLQWHFLTRSFQNYYRLLIAHLGLPQWQSLFTEDGLPPFLNQWYYMLAPGRLLIHDNTWKKLEFLNIFENIKPKSQQSQQQVKSKTPNKIEFNKLFDEKQQSKSKSQSNSNSNANQSNNSKGSIASSNTQNNTNTPNTNGLSKPKSRITVKK